MIFLIIAGIAALVGLPWWFIDSRDKGSIIFAAFCTFFLAPCFFVFGTLLPTAVAYVNDQDNIASVQQYRQNQQIYEAKAVNLTNQLKGYLAVQYPQYEAKVLKELASAPKLLFTVFPQLQASRTLVALTDEITVLQNQVYDQETNVTQAEKNVRFTYHNPFFINWFLPSHA